MRNVAQSYVDLVNSNQGLPIGTPDTKALQKCQKNLEFFGIGSTDPVRVA